SWFRHGPAASGEFAASGAIPNRFDGEGGINFDHGGNKLSGIPVAIEKLDETTCSWGLKWTDGLRDHRPRLLPEYYENGVVAEIPSEVPEALRNATFKSPGTEVRRPYVAPKSPAWDEPGPV